MTTRASRISSCKEDHDFPRLAFYRGSRSEAGPLLRPVPRRGAVKETLQSLQKLFKIRNCRDTFFANRSRPCLQHQIGRCSAPCVELISKELYAQDLRSAVKVLEGRSSEVNAELQARMEEAASKLQFERAAQIRDQLGALKRIQAQQIVTAEGERDVDIFAIVGSPGEYCISGMLVRGWPQSRHHQLFSASRASGTRRGARLVRHAVLLLAGAAARSTRRPEAGRRGIAVAAPRRTHNACRRRALPSRGLPARWVEMTTENATNALRMRVAQKAGVEEMLTELASELDMPEAPQRIECFDISHTGGEGTVASCVVFGPEGPMKKEYRRFNITGVTPGDDYAALKQALERRYTRIKDGEIPPPDLLLIDGGLGQIEQVHQALEPLGFGDLMLVGVAKGPDRRPGQERLFIYGDEVPRILESHSPASRLVQRVRDEAHRFAITGHRRKRAKRYNESVLEAVPGLGPAKRRALLKHFGGLQEVMRAGVADIEKVAGIGTTLARNIYDHLHPGA